MLKVAIAAPSGNVLDFAPIKKTEELFVKRGWKVTIGKCITSSHGRFAGKNEKLVAEEFNALCETNDLVVCARGGYGMSRILDRIDYEMIANKGTWVAGFSDITTFSMAYLAKKGGMSLQAPTASILGMKEVAPVTVEAFFEALGSRNYSLSFPAASKDLCLDGVIWGGNLTVLCSLLGTPYFPKIKDGILFVEDVGEPYYKIERNLMQLIQAGVIAKQKALLFGQFSKLRPSAHDFGYSLTDAIKYVSSRTRTPFVLGLPFGHTETLCTLVVGSQANLTVTDQYAQLTISQGPGLDSGVVIP